MVQPRARTTRRSIHWTDLIILSAATVAIWFTEMWIIQVLTNTDTTLLFNCATSPVEKALSLQVSVSYKTLSSYSPITSLPTKQAWERDLGISIDETDWQEVWTRAMDISTCSRIKSIQFKIVRGRHITPVLKNKMDANASPLCWKCKTGDYIHCLWSCVKLRLHWSDIVNEHPLFLVFQYWWTRCASYWVFQMLI